MADHWETSATNRWLQSLPDGERAKLYNGAVALAAFTGSTTRNVLDQLYRVARQPRVAQGSELARAFRSPGKVVDDG
jgi:hypothetical protein